MRLTINNSTKIKIPGRLRFKYWLEKTLTVLTETDQGEPKGETQKGIIELSFVEPEAIRRLNKQFRGVDKPTDVLSFSFLGQGKFPGDTLAGEIFIEPEIAQKQAADHGVEWREEIEFLFVHALLHVFGYDHEKEADFRRMYELQAQIMPGPKWANFVNQISLESFGREFSSRSRGQ